MQSSTKLAVKVVYLFGTLAAAGFAVMAIATASSRLKQDIFRVLMETRLANRHGESRRADSATRATGWLTPGSTWTYEVTDSQVGRYMTSVKAFAADGVWVRLEGRGPLDGGLWTMMGSALLRRADDKTTVELVVDLDFPLGREFRSSIDHDCPATYKVIPTGALPPGLSSIRDAVTIEVVRSRCRDAGVVRVTFSKSVGVLSLTSSSIIGHRTYSLIEWAPATSRAL